MDLSPKGMAIFTHCDTLAKNNKYHLSPSVLKSFGDISHTRLSILVIDDAIDAEYAPRTSAHAPDFV